MALDHVTISADRAISTTLALLFFSSFYLIVFWLTAVDLVILITIGIPSPTHSFIPGLKPSSSASPSHRSLSFSFFMSDYMDSPDCLLLLLSIAVFCFLVFFVLHFLIVGSVQ